VGLLKEGDGLAAIDPRQCLVLRVAAREEDSQIGRLATERPEHLIA
jgi:hypothetical protein